MKTRRNKSVPASKEALERLGKHLIRVIKGTILDAYAEEGITDIDMRSRVILRPKSAMLAINVFRWDYGDYDEEYGMYDRDLVPLSTVEMVFKRVGPDQYDDKAIKFRLIDDVNKKTILRKSKKFRSRLGKSHVTSVVGRRELQELYTTLIKMFLIEK